MIQMQQPIQKTAQEIAAELGVHKTTINRIAQNHKLGTPYGATRMRVFSDGEAARIAEICRFERGNPNFKKN
jgi:DNA-directed RNA polymerase specialized sigma54-like protein